MTQSDLGHLCLIPLSLCQKLPLSHLALSETRLELHFPCQSTLLYCEMWANWFWEGHYLEHRLIPAHFSWTFCRRCKEETRENPVGWRDQRKCWWYNNDDSYSEPTYKAKKIDDFKSFSVVSCLSFLIKIISESGMLSKNKCCFQRPVGIFESTSSSVED